MSIKDKFIIVVMLAAFFAGMTQACDTTCPKGQHWVWTDSKQTTGTCISDSSGGSSTSSSSSSSTSTSNQSQNQGQSQGQQQTANGGSAKSTSSATGGASTVKDSGNSSSNSSVGPISNVNTASGGSVKDSGNSSSTVKDSGNSSNKNTDVANGGAGGQGGTANATSSNNSSGNTTSISESSTYTESKIPVNTAYAAAPYPTAQCFKGGGIGGQTGVFGFSINGGKIDENCARLETARSFDAVGEYFAGCKVKVNNKYAKEAGVKLEDCLNRYVAPQSVVQTPQLPQTPTPIIVNLPAPVVNVTPTPVYIDQTPTYVPQPAYKAPRKKLNKPIGTLRPCPVTPSHNAKANCFEDD
jgi:hypothetical protein